ncbi:MAG: molybdopterin-guanine dinucleotide biosynthesis protein B, partial [Thermoproteota archaeon]|nr:molybdopterin-guanine dinucleotide biosynthesis protein B [Thermoproteota archaeon]
MPLVVGVVSRTRGRGKTTLIERLTKRFTREGFRVATVKHISGFFDTARKDTWRHLESGAVITVASTPKEIVTISKTPNPPLEKALEAIYTTSDLIFVEGYKKSSIPKILCADTTEDALVALKEISNIIMISGGIASRSQEKEKFQTEFPETPVYNFEELVSALKERLARSILRRLPGLNCGHCGYNTCLEFAKAVLKGEATMQDCEVLAASIATVTVDGKNVPIMKFVQQIVRGVTLGIINTLKGVKKHPNRIEI